jgi:hypothetical protein
MERLLDGEHIESCRRCLASSADEKIVQEWADGQPLPPLRAVVSMD